jgi:surface protein
MLDRCLSSIFLGSGHSIDVVGRAAFTVSVSDLRVWHYLNAHILIKPRFFWVCRENQQDASPSHLQWPVDVLTQMLSHLALEGSMRTFTMLGLLSCNGRELHLAARNTNAPVVIHINVAEPGGLFSLVTGTNTVMSIEVSWGDGSVEAFTFNPEREWNAIEPVQHTYASPGDYVIQIFRYGDGKNGVWLDRLVRTATTHHSLKRARITKMPSLGNLGITHLSTLFADSKEFNDPSVCDWDTSNITHMDNLFIGAASFNQPVGRWDVSRVTSMRGMFCGATAFNQPIGSWDVSNVTSMEHMFREAESFNQPIGSWNVSKVTIMTLMFNLAVNFNQPLDTWDVSNVVAMGGMFFGARSFNQPVGSWNVSKVANMEVMFHDALSFNQPLNNWNVSNVFNMSGMFLRASAFNQPLDAWDVSNVREMLQMFGQATSFKQSLQSWNLTNAENVDGILKKLRFEYLLRNRRTE